MYDRLPSKTLVKPYSWIWREDPALDHEAKDFSDRYARYDETGDESHLTIRDGMEPVRWTLRHLRDEHRRLVLDEVSRTGAATASALCASIVIESVTGIELEVTHYQDTSRRVRRVDPEVMEALGRLEGFLDEVAGTAMRRSRLDPK